MAEAGKLSKDDFVYLKAVCLAHEKSLRRAAGKYQAEGKVGFKKLVDLELANLARIMMLIGE